MLLVSDELPEAKRNDTATYLAQRTQAGSGNTQERLPAQLPTERGQPDAAGQPREPAGAERSSGTGAGDAGAGTARRIQMLPLPAALVQLSEDRAAGTAGRKPRPARSAAPARRDPR